MIEPLTTPVRSFIAPQPNYVNSGTRSKVDVSSIGAEPEDGLIWIDDIND